MREGSAVSVSCRSVLQVHSGLVLSTIFPYATITTPTPVTPDQQRALMCSRVHRMKKESERS